MTFPTKKIGSISVGAAALLMAGALYVITSPDANATSQFAKDTGKSCAACHQNPKGGGKLTAFGTKFQANGNKVPSKDGKKSPSESAPAKTGFSATNASDLPISASPWIKSSSAH